MVLQNLCSINIYLNTLVLLIEIVERICGSIFLHFFIKMF